MNAENGSSSNCNVIYYQNSGILIFNESGNNQLSSRCNLANLDYFRKAVDVLHNLPHSVHCLASIRYRFTVFQAPVKPCEANWEGSLCELRTQGQSCISGQLVSKQCLPELVIKRDHSSAVQKGFMKKVKNSKIFNLLTIFIFDDCCRT